jgi:hypothetical protein
MKNDREISDEQYIKNITNKLIRDQNKFNNTKTIPFGRNVGHSKIKEFVEKFRKLYNISYKHIELRSEYRDTLLEILYSILSRKKVYIKEENVTFRDNDIYEFNSSTKLNINILFNNQNLFQDVCDHIGSEVLASKFRETKKVYNNSPDTYIKYFPDIGNLRYTDSSFSSFCYYKTGSLTLVYHIFPNDSVVLLHYPSNVDVESLIKERGTSFKCIRKFSFNTYNCPPEASYDILRNFEDYRSLVDKAITEYDKTISFYQKEINNIKQRFKKEIVLNSIS